MLARLSAIERESKQQLDQLEALRLSVHKLDSEVRAVQTVLQSLAGMAQDLVQLRAVKKWVIGSMVAILTGVGAYVFDQGSKSERAQWTARTVVEIRETQRMQAKGVEQDRVRFAAFESRVQAWLVLQERLERERRASEKAQSDRRRRPR